MSRRGGRAPSGSVSSPEAPETVSDLHTWLRADPEDITIATGVSSWVSKVNGYTFTQGTAANQPELTTTPSLGNRRVLRFDGINDKLVSTAAASTWKFLHDGTGCTIFYVAVLNQNAGRNTVFSTSNIDVANTGFTQTIWGSSTDLLATYITNGSGAVRALTLQVASGNIFGAASIVDFSYKEGSSPEYTFRRLASSLGTGGSGAAPSTGNPTATLHVGVEGDGSTAHGLLSIAEIIIYNRELTSDEKNTVYAYLSERYVDAYEAPFDALAPAVQWRADEGIALSGSDVTTWTDRIGGLVLSATGTPAYSAADVNVGGQASITVLGGSETLVSTLGASSWKWLHDGTLGQTTYVVYYHAATAEYRFILATMDHGAEYPGFVVNCFSTSPVTAAYNGSTLTSAIANGTYTAGKRWLASRHDAGASITANSRGSLSTAWVTGSAITPSSSDPTRTLQIDTALGTIAIAEVIIFDRAITDSEHFVVVDYLLARYGRLS